MCASDLPSKAAALLFIFFFKQKTAYEIGTGDWSSDVCSSDLMLLKSLIDNHVRLRVLLDIGRLAQLLVKGY